MDHGASTSMRFMRPVAPLRIVTADFRHRK
jgi:hypothetical protein